MLSAPLVMLLRPSGLARAAAGAASLFAFVIAVAMTIGVLEGNTYTYRMGSWPAPYGIELSVGISVKLRWSTSTLSVSTRPSNRS